MIDRVASYQIRARAAAVFVLVAWATLVLAQEPMPQDVAPEVTEPATAATDTVVALAPVVQDFFDTGVNGTTAVLMTPVFPGWGQLYAEEGWRAMVAFGVQWYFWSNMLAQDRVAVRYRDYAKTLDRGGESVRGFWDARADEKFEIFRDYAWWSGGVLLLVAVDAYVGAGLHNFDEEPIPVPDRFDQYFDAGSPEPIGSRGAPPLVIAQWGWQF